eukprot:213073-Rhodomonas_salina.1
MEPFMLVGQLSTFCAYLYAPACHGAWHHHVPRQHRTWRNASFRSSRSSLLGAHQALAFVEPGLSSTLLHARAPRELCAPVVSRAPRHAPEEEVAEEARVRVLSRVRARCRERSALSHAVALDVLVRDGCRQTAVHVEAMMPDRLSLFNRDLLGW